MVAVKKHKLSNGFFKASRRKNYTVKKIFGFPRPWKPLPPAPIFPQLPSPASSKPAPIRGEHRREVFEPILSRTIEMDKFVSEVTLQYRERGGKHKIRTCLGDIYKIVNVFMDYARLLELVNDEWDLDPYRRAVNEVTADKLRSIAKRYQEAIGYDYDAELAKCEAKRKKQRTEDDVGGDALELAMNHGKRNTKKKEK